MRAIALCGSQNIPVRGHTQDDSNFYAILTFLALDDKDLAEHLSNPSTVMKYTCISPDIQNEIVILLWQQIRSKILNECNSVKCFSLIADEATDRSTAEQVAICVRFYYENAMREECLGFVKAESTTGEALAE